MVPPEARPAATIVVARPGPGLREGSGPAGIEVLMLRRSAGSSFAPDFLPVRFDARFFSVAAPRGLEPRPNLAEVDGAWWMAPADVLVGQREGSASLMWPTLKTMEALAGCASVQDALALRVAQVA